MIQRLELKAQILSRGGCQINLHEEKWLVWGEEMSTPQRRNVWGRERAEDAAKGDKRSSK